MTIPTLTGARTLRRIPLRALALAVTAALVAGPLAAQAPPGTTTSTHRAGADFEGFHGSTTCEAVAGWAWDPARPDWPVEVDILQGDSLLATVPADLFRRDLREAGKGNGEHGFHFALPAGIEERGDPVIRVRIAGTASLLGGSPRVLPCRADEVERAPGRVTPGRVAGAATGPKRIAAMGVERGAVLLDGRLDDAVWDEASFSGDFMQKGPDRAYPPSQRTRIAFVYDDAAIYVGARMESEAPQDLRTLVGRRDEGGQQERLLVSFDTYRDRRTAYTFGVTTAGVRLDHYHPEDYENRTDDSYDPVWEARTARDSLGWTAEMRIPFSQLRFPSSGTATWGLNVRRFDPGSFLNVYWVVVPVAETGWASEFGELNGLEEMTPRRRIEIAPYVLGAIKLAEPALGGDETTTRFGGDAKLGLGPNLTLDVTANPDFGQVEADPAEINLSQFETTFEERRPFFLEGAHLLGGSGPRYFYTRRIGSVPWLVPGGSLLTPSQNGTILGAAKLTGRLDSGLSVGALAALTQPERSPVVDDLGERVAVVAPGSLFGVARLRQEWTGSGSTAGLLFTGVQRDLPGDGFLERILGRTALSGGGDWTLRLAGGDYVIGGHAGFSHVMGDTAAILRLQRSAGHYFQRPDATHVREEPDRKSLTGYTAGLTIAKQGGESFLWDIGAAAESPGFEIRDAGAFRSADDVEAFVNLRFRHLRPGSFYRNYHLALFGNGEWNFEGVRTFNSAGLFAQLTWSNFLRTFLRGRVDFPALSDELTRGGPLMGTPLALNVGLGLANSFAAQTQWSLDTDLHGDEFGGWSAGASTSLTTPIFSHLQLTVSPGYLRSEDTRQFFTSRPGASEATFGRRYIFSLIDRSEIYAQLRLSVAPTPDLTLDLYAEPFASSGRFHDFGELAAAGSSRIRFYGDDGTTIAPDTVEAALRVVDGEDTFLLHDADFHIRSFRSNAVLRWEWRRGSSLFLIWQQNRFGSLARPDDVSPASLWDSVQDDGEDILTIKLSYWLGMD